MRDASFEVRFTVPLEVRNINDAVVNEAAVIAAAKAGARAEVERQLSAAIAAGDFNVDFE
jgi:hypothetical protein